MFAALLPVAAAEETNEQLPSDEGFSASDDWTKGSYDDSDDQTYIESTTHDEAPDESFSTLSNETRGKPQLSVVGISATSVQAPGYLDIWVGGYGTAKSMIGCSVKFMNQAKGETIRVDTYDSNSTISGWVFRSKIVIDEETPLGLYEIESVTITDSSGQYQTFWNDWLSLYPKIPSSYRNLSFSVVKQINGSVIWNENDVAFKGSTAYVIADGKEQTPGFTVKDSDGNIIDSKYYNYSYLENINAGTGYVNVTFKVDYKGTCRGVFKIYLPPTTTTTVENVSNGIKLTWSKVTGADGYVIYRRAWSSTTGGWTDFVRWNNTTALNWTDTKVYAGTRYQYGIKAYFNKRTDPVTGTQIGGNVGDNYNLGEVGPLKTTVRITTRTLNSVTAGTKQMTVKWAASGLFTGYQIQYATNSAFTQNAVAIKITNPKTASTVIKSLTSGKTYYVRIRSYHVFNGVTYFGGWSNVLSCKVK